MRSLGGIEAAGCSERLLGTMRDTKNWSRACLFILGVVEMDLLFRPPQQFPGRVRTMLVNARHLKDLVIRAKDGELGTVDQVYFDDETWAIRYFVVDTGKWLEGRRVLISPFSVIQADWAAKRLDVALTKEQVKHSPDIDTHKPVSRQHEAAYIGYYGYPSYWGGPCMWGAGVYPSDLPFPTPPAAGWTADQIRQESADSHLRSFEAVTGYNVDATDGEIGHLNGFVVDDRAWAIRYIEVATRNWWPGKKVLVSPAWIERVSWTDSMVYAGLSREAIQNAPEYIESEAITREYENRLYFHYGLPPYWVREAEQQSALALTSL
jgi:hypothetical protein